MPPRAIDRRVAVASFTASTASWLSGPCNAAMPRHRVLIGHVNAIDIGPLLAIDFDRDAVLVEDLRDGLALERLVRHHVAPVAGRVTDAQENRLLLRARPGKRRLAPRQPRD